MYIPKNFLATDQQEIVAFMQQYSFATLITSVAGVPTGTHLPFLVRAHGDRVVLTSHFARANKQWETLEQTLPLVIFNEPHAYISPRHYNSEMNVPTWNYFSVHAYGKGRLITELDQSLAVLEATIDAYEAAYREQWEHLSLSYKQKMVKGIVAFEIVVTDLQAKKKLSQNKTVEERQNIIKALKESDKSSGRSVAMYMEQDLSQE